MTSTRSAGRPLLELHDVDVEIPLAAGVLHAVRGVSLSASPGESVGLVGESGSGKSLTLRAAMDLLPVPARITGGSIVVDGVDVTGLPALKRREHLSSVMAMIFQDSLTALNPTMRIGDQVAEVPRRRLGMKRAAAHERAVDLLNQVGIRDPERRYRAFPHELSGGMRQRVCIAIALSAEPGLILADEPTTALDVTIQAQVLGVLENLRRERGVGIVLVTHDLAVVSGTCEELNVMYGGRIVEHGRTAVLLDAPRHPLHRGPAPLGARSRSARTPAADHCGAAARPAAHDARLPVRAALSGRGRQVPTRAAPAVGRRPRPQQRLLALLRARTVAGRHRRAGPARAGEMSAGVVGGHGEELLGVEGLVQHFAGRADLWQRLARREQSVVKAVDGVDLSLCHGETLGLVGESGCGKSTLSRCAAGLYTPTSGTIRYAGQALRGAPSRQQRRLVQMVFQDPYSSLNPRMNVGQILGEVLRYHQIVPRSQVPVRVRELLDLVGLPQRAVDQLPRSFSGGQRQRIGIARALALKPRVLIADEPVSALDVSVQANIINLLLDLKETLGLSMLFVSHNMAVVRQISDRIAVMHAGVVVEEGLTDRVFEHPQHDYTRLLLASVPRLATSSIPAAKGQLD